MNNEKNVEKCEEDEEVEIVMIGCGTCAISGWSPAPTPGL